MTLFASSGELYHGLETDLELADTTERDRFSLVDAMDYQIESPADLAPGQTCIVWPNPGDTAAEAVVRLRQRYPSYCIRRDDFLILYHGTRLRRGGRLRAWTGLRKGQALCWGMNADQAVRIAQYLERRGLGRFIVFDDGEWTWVRRMG